LQLFSAPCSSAASESLQPDRHYNETNHISSVTKQAGPGWQSLCFLTATSMQLCRRMTDLFGFRLAWLSEKWKSSHSRASIA